MLLERIPEVAADARYAVTDLDRLAKELESGKPSFARGRSKRADGVPLHSRGAAPDSETTSEAGYTAFHG